MENDEKIYGLIDDVLKIHNVYNEEASWYDKLQTVLDVAPCLKNTVNNIENAYVENFECVNNSTIVDIQEYMNKQTGLKNFMKF